MLGTVMSRQHLCGCVAVSQRHCAVSLSSNIINAIRLSCGSTCACVWLCGSQPAALCYLIVMQHHHCYVTVMQQHSCTMQGAVRLVEGCWHLTRCVHSRGLKACSGNQYVLPLRTPHTDVNRHVGVGDDHEFPLPGECGLRWGETGRAAGLPRTPGNVGGRGWGQQGASPKGE